MTYAEFFYEIKTRFMGADVSDIHEHLAYQFCIEDEEAGGIFYVEVKDGQLHVEPYEYYDKHANFICGTDTLLKIADGKLDPVTAFTLGQLRVEGDIDKALRLKEIIEMKKKAEKEAAKKAKKEAKKAEKVSINKKVKKPDSKKTDKKITKEKKVESKKADKKVTTTKKVGSKKTSKTTSKNK